MSFVVLSLSADDVAALLGGGQRAGTSLRKETQFGKDICGRKKTGLRMRGFVHTRQGLSMSV
jgi:hypothetical protein